MRALGAGNYLVTAPDRWVEQDPSMDIDTAELREGLAATWPYLLSHHPPSQYHRCWSLSLAGRKIHLCARCSGIYPGILLGLVTYWVGPAAAASLAVVALLPAPALLDWAVTAFTSRKGSNLLRTATGLTLGYAYGLGLAHLASGDIRVLAIGLPYAVAAALLLRAAGPR